MCDVISPSLALPIFHSLFHNGQYKISWVPWQPDFSIYTKLKLKTSICNCIYYKNSVWSYFVKSFCRNCQAHSSFLILQWSIFSKMSSPGRQISHLTETKNLYLYLKTYCKNVVGSCCVTSFCRRCTANPSLLVLQWSIYNYFSSPDIKTSQITPNWNKKPLFVSQGLQEKLSLKLLPKVIFQRCPASPSFFVLQWPIFSEMTSP